MKNFNKYVVALISFIMLIVVVPVNMVNASAAPVFSDINKHWAQPVILDAVAKGWIAGYPDGTFRPDAPVKVDEFIRLMIASVTVKLSDGRIDWSPDYYAGLDAVSKNVLMKSYDTFDLNAVKSSSSYWAQPYIDQAKKLGFVYDGDSYIAYDYQKGVSREEAAVLINNILKYYELMENEKYANMASQSVKDYQSISYKLDVDNIIIKGVMRGYPDGTFLPKRIVTRAEALVMLDHVMNKKARSPYVPDLTNYPHVEYQTTKGLQHVVFQSKEFLDGVALIKDIAAKTTRPVYSDVMVARFYTTKEVMDNYYGLDMSKIDSFFVPDPAELQFGITELGGNDNYYLAGDPSTDYMTTDKAAFDAVVNSLFGDEAATFTAKFKSYGESVKAGTNKTSSFKFNSRNVGLMKVSSDAKDKTFIAYISEKY